MSPDGCDEMRFLVQAEVDGELEPADAARVAAHLQSCATCERLQARFLALSARLKIDVPSYQAPDGLRAIVRSKLSSKLVIRPRLSQRWRSAGLGAGVGALAACIALFVMMPRGDMLPDWVVAAHIRGLQPDHLFDVPSGEQHTVKPWFAGRLPFSPPVKDLSAQGFPLAGGRLDYLPGNTAATLVYKRRQHVVDLFIWPARHKDYAGGTGKREGYNYISWLDQGMVFWAVSDLNATELGEFASLWH